MLYLLHGTLGPAQNDVKRTARCYRLLLTLLSMILYKKSARCNIIWKLGLE